MAIFEASLLKSMQYIISLKLQDVSWFYNFTWFVLFRFINVLRALDTHDCNNYWLIIKELLG